jgi:hypothetical protein
LIEEQQRKKKKTSKNGIFVILGCSSFIVCGRKDMIPTCVHSYVFGACPVLGCQYYSGMNSAYPGLNYPPVNTYPYPYPYPYPNSYAMTADPIPYPAGTAPLVQAEVIPADQVIPGASFVQGRVVQDTVIQGTVISDTVVHGRVIQEEGIIQGKAVPTPPIPPPKPPRRRPSTDNTTPPKPPPPTTSQQQQNTMSGVFPTTGMMGMSAGYPATQTTCVHGFPVGMCFYWECNRPVYEQFQMNSFSSYCNTNLFTSSGLKSVNPAERQSAFKQLTSAWDSVPEEGKDQVKEYLQDQLVDVSGDVAMEILELFTS